MGWSRSNPVPASPIQAGRNKASVTGAGRVTVSLTRKLPSASGRALIAMPGWAAVSPPAGVGTGEVFGVGEIVRTGTLAGVPTTGAAAEPGIVSPAPTATAAPSRLVTITAPIERRTTSRARDRGTCPLPRRP